MQELLVNNININRIEGDSYQTGMMFTKKYFLYGSRKLTYDVMKFCINKGYAFTVNDCSARKFGRIE